jgi:magnesium transporter
VTEQVTTRRELNIQSIKHNGLTWVNIEGPSIAEIQFLQENYPFHPLDLDDCLSKVQLPKLDQYQDYIFLVLHFPIFNDKIRVNVPGEVDIFVGPDYLITVHQGQLRLLNKLFLDCQQSEEMRANHMSKGSGRLLYHMLRELVDHCFPMLNALMLKVDAVEERVFEGSASQTVRELSMLRRDIISYRHIIRPQIDVLELLEERRIPFLKVDPDVYFGDLADHARHIWVELEDLREVMDSLSDSHNSLASHHTNQVMRVLTVITTIMLPLIVVTGIYAQNIPLPFQEQTIVFPILIASMVLVAVAMFAVFLWKRWL